jgi:formate dehydrogenase alpha subunit
VKGLGETFGSGAMTNDFKSIRDADVMLVIGSNTTEAHPVIGAMIRQRKREGATLVVCDPRRIELAQQADIHLRQKSGTDVALVNGMMHVILRENLQDGAFIAERVENFDALREAVASYTPGRVSEITGVPADLVEKAARAYARGPNSAIFYTMGITQHVTGTNNVRTMANLALLCGMLGRPGTGVNPLRGQNNVQGACDMGCLPDVFSGYQKVADPAARERMSAAWNGAKLPEAPGLSVVRMMEAAAKGDIRALFIMGENPMVTDPDTHHARKSLDSLDLLVVQDIFLTETAQLADVVLPAACWGEKEGTFTNTCRAVQRVRKAVEPPGEARADWEIIDSIARRMGASWEFRNPSGIFDAIARVTPSYAGMSHARLDAGGPIPWPCPSEGHPGTPILHASRFARPNGKASFSPCEWRPPHEWPDDEYPFLATTGRLLYHYHSGSMTRRSAPGEFVRELYVEVHPADAERMDIPEGGTIRVTSRRGSVEGRAKVTDRVPPGMVFLPFHFGESSANILTAAVIDPDSETPGYKVSAVRVEKVFPKSGPGPEIAGR